MGSAVMASLRPHDSRFNKMAGDHSFMAKLYETAPELPPVFPGIFMSPGIAARLVLANGTIREPLGSLPFSHLRHGFLVFCSVLSLFFFFNSLYVGDDFGNDRLHASRNPVGRRTIVNELA